MKKVILFPGFGENSDSIWFPYVSIELSRLDFEVKILRFPDPNDPVLSHWLSVALRENYDGETVLIGHSSGVAVILSVLEKIDVKIQKVVLVAGFVRPLAKLPDVTPILQENYNWEKIKSQALEFVTINGVNDPWGCDDIQGREIFDNLGGMLILNNEGHMGSDTYEQPYKEFPLLLKLLN